MIKIQYIKEAAGVKKGTIREWPEKTSGLVRRLVNEGVVKILREKPAPEKKEAPAPFESKKPEKIESKEAPKKPAKKR